MDSVHQFIWVLLFIRNVLPLGIVSDKEDQSKVWGIRFSGCDESKWNPLIPPTANLVSSVCEMKLEVEPSSENDLWIFLLLSTRSDDLDRVDQIRLIQQLSPAGSTILFSRKHSAKGPILEDVRNVNLAIPKNVCGQMFLIACVVDQNKNLSSACWPFQIICETNVDLTLAVGISPDPPGTGALQRNRTLIPGLPLAQQLPGWRIIVSSTNRSTSIFQGRTSPSTPPILVYLTSQKHAPLKKSAPSYKRLELHLGDVILHAGKDLLDLQPGQSSPPLTQGQAWDLNVSFLQLRSTAICGEAWIVFLLQLEDLDVENNFAILPVFIDCWGLPELMGENLGSCGVIPDEMSMGKSALMYTTGQPYGFGVLKAYLYKTDEKTFLPVRVASERKLWTEIPGKFLIIQKEKNRLSKMNRCPEEKSELRIPFSATIFGQIHAVLDDILFSWRTLNVTKQKRQQEKIQLVFHAIKGLLAASTTYNALPANFVDAILNGVFKYWPYFPLNLSPAKINTSWNATNNLTWHDHLTRTAMYYLRQQLFLDYEGKINPKHVIQNFLNNLLWSPEVLRNPTFPGQAVDQLRQLLLFILQNELPRTFDDLPSNILDSLSNFLFLVRQPVPINTDQVRSALEDVGRAVYTAADISRASQIQPTLDKLEVIGSLIDTLKDLSIIQRLTRIILMIQENSFLNKQWVLMDGMSDLSLDAELLCRLKALDRINFRSDAKAHPNYFMSKLHLITFWKTDSGAIYRGDLSSITGRLYWNRIAVCYCDNNNIMTLQHKSDVEML